MGPVSTKMTTSRLPVLFIAIGVLLVAASLVWPYVVGGRRAWSEQDAEQYEQSRVELHSLREQFGKVLQGNSSGGTDGLTATSNPAGAPQQDAAGNAKLREVTDRIAQAEERFKGLEAKLNKAQSDGYATAELMRWIGVGVLSVGVLGFYSARSGTK